jgi:peroxiredoxin
MRYRVIVFLTFFSLGVLGQEAQPTPEGVMELHFRMYRETVYTASYVLNATSMYEDEEVFSMGGSIILWMEYPRARVEATGLEEVMYPAMVADLGERILYTHDPAEGWTKHVLAGEWLAMIDPRYDPLFRRIEFTSLEEDSLDGAAVWVVQGTLAPDPLGIMPRAELSIWIDKETYADRKLKVLFETYIPGLDITLVNEYETELISFTAVEDIPDEKFAVPADVPATPDLNGRVFPYPAPDLRGRTVDGQEISLRDLSGNVVIVFFWDMDTEIEENLGLNLLLMEGIRQRGEDKGVTVIGVTEGHPEIVAAFLEGFEAGIPTVVDRERWAEALGVTEETWCVVIDRDGNVYATADPFTAVVLLLELLEPVS